MYQFTTNTILNSLTDSSGYDKVTSSSTNLKVKRVNDFVVSNIVSIHKRPYSAGVKEIATVVMPTITAGKVARLNIEIGLEQSANHEYASVYVDFQKPLIVEVIATGTVDTDGAALVAELNKLKDRFGHTYVTATYTAGTDTITLTAKEDNQRFNSVTVEEETENTNTLEVITFTVKATGSVSTAGKLGFGDDAWMIQNVKLPTIENQRYYAIDAEERPVLGGNYSQYIIRYSVTKDHDDGIVSGLSSVTTHVFWVKSDLVSSFETLLDATSVAYTFAITNTVNGSGQIEMANDATVTLTTSGNVGPVTWVETTDANDAITITSAGVVTSHATNDGTATVTGTDSVGNTLVVTIVVA